MQEPYLVPHNPRPVDILYRDDDLLLVHKPHLLLSIPGRHPQNQDCLINRLREQFATASIVHRLDLDTSGIMVIPLNRPAHSDISRQFQQRRVDKSYEAVVFGLVESDEGEIDLPIAPDWSRRPRQKTCAERGKTALTRYRVLSRCEKKQQTRLLLRPVTGRSHQLRLHLSEIGHPILGCDLYAHRQALSAAPRLLLHATQLRLTQPSSGKILAGESPPEF